MLVATLEGRRIEAWIAEKGPDYACPDCRKAVVLKKGRVRVAYFAHLPPVTCTWARGETKEHMAAKEDFHKTFAARGLQVEVEHVLDCLPGDRRADVMVWSPNGKRFAIEIQHTSIDLDQIEARTDSYHRADVGVIWVGLLRPGIWDNAVKTPGGYVIRRYTARPWERWVHGYSYGQIWLYDPDGKTLWKGRLDKHEIRVEESSWYDSDGSENSAGGYTRISKRWKELTLSGPHALDDVKIDPFWRKATSLGRYNFPGGRAARFIVNAEQA